jgi:hypothetical protein
MLTLEIRGGAHNAEITEVSRMNTAPFAFPYSDSMWPGKTSSILNNSEFFVVHLPP